MNNQGFHPEVIERGLITVVMGNQTDSTEHCPECVDIFSHFLKPDFGLVCSKKINSHAAFLTSFETAVKKDSQAKASGSICFP